jgi:hypothetical protein
VSRLAAALCHAVRLEGNRVIHYTPDYPDDPKSVTVPARVVASTLCRVLEVAEEIGCGGRSVYLELLDREFADLYRRLGRDWRPALDGLSSDPFRLYDLVEIVFRSVVPSMKPAWLGLLEQYETDRRLPDQMDRQDEDDLRQLRNLGLIGHDGPHLFAGHRSRFLGLTPPGRMLVSLARGTVPADVEAIAREIADRFKQALAETANVGLLRRIKDGRSLAVPDRARARELRNLYLLSHDQYYLEASDEFWLTDLGYYVLGRHTPD